MRAPALLVAVLAAVPAVHGLYFHVAEGDERCFVEDLPEDTMVVGSYKSPDAVAMAQALTAAGHKPIAITIRVQDAFHNQILSQVAEVEGRFAFTSEKPGEHFVCLSANVSETASKPRNMRFELRLDVGEGAIEYARVAKHDDVRSVRDSMDKVVQLIGDIMHSHERLRERDEAFRAHSDSANARIMYFSLFQMAVVLASAWWQISHLKSFFIKKKLI